MTTKTLSKFEDLVYRSTYLNEFLEDDLQALLDPVFDSPWQLTHQYYNEVKRLFFLIANMNKSTNFGYYFYGKMQNNPFPFCDEILKSAVLTEKYYNLHDKALKSYVRSYMIKDGVEPKNIIDYDNIIPEGHGTHFMKTFQLMKNHKVNIRKPVKPDFFNLLYIAINNDKFPMTQKKVSCIVAHLNIECLLPALSGKATHLINKPDINIDKALVIIHYLQSVGFLLGVLPEDVQDAIQCLIHYDQRSEIVEKFYTLKSVFQDYLDQQKVDVYSFH
jgi:hypothetical protein